MNKKGQITLNEVFIVVVLALLGVAFWFIDDGIRNWIMQRFPNSNTFMIGIIIIGVILFFIKYPIIFQLPKLFLKKM